MTMNETTSLTKVDQYASAHVNHEHVYFVGTDNGELCGARFMCFLGSVPASIGDFVCVCVCHQPNFSLENDHRQIVALVFFD